MYLILPANCPGDSSENGTRPNVPDYMVKDGITYRIVASPRLAVDAATGVVVQELRYDEFRRVTLDTNPGFQPFGFAGGLDGEIEGGVDGYCSIAVMVRRNLANGEGVYFGFESIVDLADLSRFCEELEALEEVLC